MDEDGALNYDEFKAVWTGFAAVHSQLNLNLYDANQNYMLDPEELEVWKTEGKLTSLSTRFTNRGIRSFIFIDSVFYHRLKDLD